MADATGARRRGSSDTGMLSRRTSPRSFSTREATTAGTTSRFCPRNNEFKSLTSDGKIFVRRSASPQFFCRESERSGTTVSVDQKSDSSGSPSFHRGTLTKRRRGTPFFFNDSEHSRGTSESKSPVWADIGISPGQSTSPQYFHYEARRSETATSVDRETVGAKSPEWSKEILTKRDMDFERERVQTTLGQQSSHSKSPLYEEKILKGRSASPQFFCRESERSATTVSIDRAPGDSRSPSHDREIVTKRTATPRFFLDGSEQSRRTSKSKSPVWGDVSPKRSVSTRYFRREAERFEAASTDRKTVGSKSSEWSKGTLAKRDTTDFDRKKVQRSANLDRRSPIWGDRGISSGQTTHYNESKRSETAVSADRETIESKSPEWSKRNRPRFFCRESERSGTTMSIDREVSEPSSYDRHTLKRSATPRLLNGKIEQRSAAATSIARKYDGLKSPGITRDKRTTSPQFFCKESEKSATTVLIEPRSADSIKSILKQRVSDTSYGRSVNSPTDKKVISTRYRHTPSPSFTRHEAKRASSEKNEVSDNITKARRSSKISETSSTSASSIVNLKYGLEFDNIFQSAGLVRKFMKSQDGKRAIRQSPSRRDFADVSARISARGNQSKNRRKTSSPLLQTARSPSVERKRRTPEFSRKAVTPTEVDMDIQEITMTDHRIVRDKLQKASSPIPKRQFDGTYTKSPGGRAKFKTSVTYPVRKTHGRRESVLGSSVFERDLSERRFTGRRSDREGEGGVVSLNKFEPVNEGSCTVTRDKEDGSRMSSQTRKQSAGNQHIATQSTRHEDRRASSRSPSRMRNRFAGNRADSPRATSPDFSRVRKDPDSISPISHDIAERTKRARTKFSQSQSLRSTRLVQGAAEGRNLPADDECNRGGGGDKNKNVAVDEVDEAGIGVKYQTVVETALNREDYRKITRPNSADRIRRVFLRETTQKPTKLSTSKETISPTRDCGRRRDMKSRVSPRVSHLRKTAEISRDAYTPKIFLSRSIVSKGDQSSKLSTRITKDESVLVAKKLAESFDKMSVKRKAEEPKGSGRESSKMPREDKYKRDLERMDSVESALKRFDSIGAEFELSSPTNFRASPEISLQTIDVQSKPSIKDSIASEGMAVPSREVTARTTLRSTLKSPVGRDLKAENVARKSDLRILRKEISPSKRVGGSTESKQRPTKIRSPTCKRRLFESDLDKEIQEGRRKSSCVKARNDENGSFVNFRFREDETVSNVKSSKSFGRDTATESRSEEMPTVSVKPLRSIDDIRKSIDYERSKLVAAEESRSAIANRRSASREGVDAKRSSPATNAAKNVFREADPARLIKIKSCVSRITKSPSPDPAATKQRETNARATRGSAPSSPSKSPEVAARVSTIENRWKLDIVLTKITFTKLHSFPFIYLFLSFYLLR